MKRIVYLLLFFATIGAVTAQTEKEETHAEEEKKTDNRLGRQAQEKLDAGTKKVVQGLFKPKADTKYEENYPFDVTLTYHIDVFKKNGKKKDESDMAILLNRSSKCIAMVPIEEGKKQESLIVYDAENSVILTLITDKDQNKSGMIMKYSPKEVEIEERNEISFKKTAEKKDILGYSCQKYIGTDENGETEYWITDQVNLNMRDVFGVMIKDKSNKSFDFGTNYPKGMVMESTTTEKNGASTTMTITELQLKANKNINTEEYQMMSLENMFNPSKDD